MSSAIRQILILQLGDSEEIFRSLMALKAVKHLYPDCSISVICREEVSAPMKRVSFIEKVLEIPRIKEGEEAVAKVALWIDQVINQHYDLLANWTSSKKYSRMAAITTSLIPALVKVGDYIRSDYTQGSYDAWTMYREAWMKDESIDQDIHVTDMITTQLLTLLQIHAGDPTPESGSVSVTSKYFFEPNTGVTSEVWQSRTKGLKWAAVHMPSLSDRATEWVDMVLRRHPDFGVILIGTQTEEYQNNPRVITIADSFSFETMMPILSQCAWLVSGESPIVDLASLLNMRIFYAPKTMSRRFALKWAETGPYGNGHIVMSSEFEWKPELAYAAWSFYQSEWFHKNTLSIRGHFENLGLGKGLDEVQIYKSRIRPAGEGGGVSYEKAEGVSVEFESWIYRVRGQIARAWFCGWLPSVDQEVAKLSLNPVLIKKIRALNESLLVMERLAQEGHAYAIELSKAASKTRSGYLMSVEEREGIEIYGKKILEVEALMSRVILVEPELRCLLKWYQQMMHNLQGETVTAMAKETMHGFDLVAEAVELLMVYTKKTLELAKPKAVQPQAQVFTLPS